MAKQMWWAGLAVALTVALSGCDEVKSCKEGTDGCIAGTCTDDDDCKFGLSCVLPEDETKAVCAKELGSGRYDFGTKGEGKAKPIGGGDDGGTGGDDGGTGGDDGGVEPGCECEGTATCTTDTGECVDFCEVPDRLPGSEPKPEPIFCEKAADADPDLTYDELCVRHCKLQCQRREWFCGEKCEDDACADEGGLPSVQALADCQTKAPGVDTEMLQTACQDVRAWECRNTVCSNGEAPDSCDGVLCSNDPQKCGYRFDGFCDDGDTYNTMPIPNTTQTDSRLCVWGTDCTDCGPRRPNEGDIRPVDLPQGAVCNFPQSCAGYKEKEDPDTGDTVPDLETISSWCLALDFVVEGLARCVPDCSGANEECPRGYRCVQLQNGVEQGNLKASACVPTCMSQ